jgi:hypothetical protein
VGRAPESAKVAALLARHRMVTVTGPGGSGKTRLAIEVARGVVSRFEDGVWLVEQAQIEHPGLVPTAAAIALGVREQPGLSLAESLAAVIGGRHVLLVLDNCEHVIDAAAGLCDGLLRVGDDLRVLATGREPLGVAGEVRFRCRHCRCRPARRRRGLRDASPSRFSPTVPARLTPTSRSPRVGAGGGDDRAAPGWDAQVRGLSWPSRGRWGAKLLGALYGGGQRQAPGHGEDAIYFEAAKNRYVGAVSYGYATDGTRLRRKVSGPVRPAAISPRWAWVL